MELKEARAIATRIRVDRIIHGAATDDPPSRSGSAIIILDDRITEFEKWVNDLLKKRITELETELVELRREKAGGIGGT